jgi:pimeloyl-ACP methyl ester carboxylesterase
MPTTVLDVRESRRVARRWKSILVVVLGLVVALTAFIYVSYRRDMKVANARVDSGSSLVSTACGQIEYASVGTGLPVLVIHGTGGGFDQGLEFARPLVEHGFKVIAPSRFGYLRTHLPQDASPAAQADAHECLLEAMKLDRVAVFGGSAGAPSAMQLCLRHSERCSVMMLAVPLAYRDAQEAPALPPPRLREFLIETTLRSDFIFWAMSKLARETTIKTILATPPKDMEMSSADEQARVAEILDHIEPISRREKGLRNDAAVARSLSRYDLERLNVPTMVMSVEDDLFNTYTSARYTAAHIRGARFIGYPTGGHLWVGHQQEVWSEVVKFLSSAR